MAEKPHDFIELDEEVDGDYDSASDFVFCRIGAPVPLKPSDSSFDLENPPARPLAVSQRFRVLFIAQSDGFVVVKTKDVIGMAKEIKEIEEKRSTEQTGKQACIHGSSIVCVQIGRVHILALSTDSSTLVATVGGRINFFSVPSLLVKEGEPFFSFSLSEPGQVKDFQWRKDMEKSFVILSSHGLLYHGNLEGHPKDVMNDVDAVDWSIEGNFLVVARKNTISIFSSSFIEQLEMSLLFQSWINETDSEGTMKVDSIKWLRSDTIIIGCIQVNEDGKEDGYLVQVIISRGCGFSEASCKPETITFNELFRGIVDDILPFGAGPYLFVSYLDRWELVIAAHRKNNDDHIVLLGLSVSDNRREAVALEFDQDKFSPRIELQENGNDNLILGLDVDKVSVYENLKLKMNEEVMELSPRCILFSLTCEGKLILYHVARFSEPPVRLQTSSSPPDGMEEKFSTVAPLAIVSSATTTRLEDDRSVPSDSKLREISKQAPNVNTGKEFKSFGSSHSSGVDNGANSFSEKDQGRSSSELGFDTTQTSNLVPFSIESAQKEVFSSALRSSVKPGTQSFNFNSAESVTSLSSVGSVPSGPSPSRQPNDVLTSNEVVTGMSDLSSYHSTSVGLQSTGKIIVADGTSVNSSSSRSILGNTDENIGTRTYASASCGFSSGLPSPAKTINLKDSSFTSSSSEGHRTALAKAGNVEYPPAICHSPVLSNDGNVAGKMMVSKEQRILDKLKSYKSTVVLDSKREFPKHYYNVNDMTMELDALLSDIEQEGGYRDACTVFQRGSVVALEEGLANLSERCRMCKATIDGQFAKIQQLQDRMIQVSARQIYMEGVVKQASNHQYWDLWNRRRLGPEFELKRQQIMKLNQNLMNQRIELERYFNAIELNKFGESEVPTGRRGLLGSLESSRQSQYLHSLYSTLNSQLAAAEQLSDCLSKHMAALNVNSPSVKQQSTAKELLESIGLTHDTYSFQSPDVKKTSSFPDSAKKISLSSSCSAFKEHPRRNTLSALKRLEPETARRRRDSLDRSWASFEPQKTTVKRMLQEDLFMGSADISFGTTKEQYVSQMVEGFPSAQLKGHDTLTSSSQPSINKSQPHTNRALKGIQEKPSRKDFESQSTSVFKWSKNLSGSSETFGSKSPVMQVTKTTDTQPPSSMMVLPQLFSRVQNGTNENSDLAEKWKSGRVQTEQHVFSKVEYVSPKRTTFNTQSRKPTLGETSSDISSSVLPATASSFINTVQVKAQASAPVDMRSAEDVLTNSSMGSMKHGSNIPVNALSMLHKNHVSSSGVVSGNALQVDSLMSKSPSSDIVPAIALPRTISGATPAVLPSLPSSTSAIQPPLPSSRLQSSQLSSPFSLPPDSSASSPPLVHPSVASLTSGPALSTPLASGFFAEGQATSFSGTATVFPPVSSSPSVVSSTTLHLAGTTSKEKDEALSSAVPQEDEMEEEAPDTTSMLNFGALGGFMLQSTSGTSAPKPNNPFGSSFASAATSSATSPVSLTTPHGEFFRPASFNLPSSQPVQLSQPMNPTGFSGGFSGFGQPAQIGSGQQAMGSVLGAFGQSRQLGGGTMFGSSAGGFGGAGAGGFPTVASSGGGFAGAATGGGFSAVASGGGGGFAGAATGGGGGFAGVATGGGGGFASAATGGGGFAGSGSGGFSAIASGGGFAGASTGGGGFGAADSAGGGFGGATSASGFASGGFGTFGGNQGTGGFSAFGGNNSAGTRRPPGELLMQMRK